MHDRTNGDPMFNVTMKTGKKALRGKVRVLSACFDSQTASEAMFDRQTHGMATVALDTIVKQTLNPTWLQVRQLFDKTIREVGATNQNGVIASSTLLSNDEVLF